MSLRLQLLLLSLVLLTPLWGQEVGVVQSPDSLIVIEDVEPVLTEVDSVVISIDSVNVQVSDTLPLEDPVVLPAYMAQTLLASWRRNYPFTEPLSDVMKQVEADTLNPSPLRQQFDSILFESKSNFAQNDLRMPLVIDGNIPPRSHKSITQQAQEAVSDPTPWKTSLYTNPYQEQQELVSMRAEALHNHLLHHLRSVKRFRNNRTDLPIERKFIDRQELSGEEQIDAGLGLELEETSLNVEQITFHADKWHRRGTTDLQISQTALSENWYKGGDNNMTLSTYDKLVFSRYDESKKTTLDITLELRLSGYYTKADTIHPMRVNDNQFRVDVSYGYKAWKNWYYSTTAYVKTPIFEYFNANSKTVKSNFFAPLEFNTAVGMDLKLTKRKNFNYSLMIAPLSYNLKYVADERVSVTSFGIKENRRQLNQIGASITNKLEWKINESVNWSSRAYFFTSYHNAQIEFENTFNVKLGRYSTAKVYLYPRFDDSVDDKWQMKEMLTFGLAFVW